MRIILGSQSKHRKKILAEMGYEFETMSADIDEKAIRHEDPRHLTLRLAHAKADALVSRIEGPALLITSDTVAVCNGVILEKPRDADEVRHFYSEYGRYPAGTVGSVVITNTSTGKRVEGIDEAAVYFNPIPAEIVEQLIEKGEIFDYAGAFTLYEPLLQAYVERIEGETESIEGLPKTMTERLLKEITE